MTKTPSSSLAVIESDSVVVSMMRASTALAEAKTISQTKKILDVAAAAEIYARRQHLSDEAMDIATSIKVEAMRKLGEMLKATPKNKGVEGKAGPGRGKPGAEKVPGFDDAPTLAELGLTKKESAFAQKLAELPEAEFQEVREGHITATKAVAAAEKARAEKADKPAAAKPKAAKPVVNEAPEEEDDGPSAEELAASEREEADEQSRLRLLLDSDEPLAAAHDRIKEQDAEIRILKERVLGLTNECAAAIRQAKIWRTKFEKLERTGVAA